MDITGKFPGITDKPLSIMSKSPDITGKPPGIMGKSQILTGITGKLQVNPWVSQVSFILLDKNLGKLDKYSVCG